MVRARVAQTKFIGLALFISAYITQTASPRRSPYSSDYLPQSMIKRKADIKGQNKHLMT
jgi:hypothetical protein